MKKEFYFCLDFPRHFHLLILSNICMGIGLITCLSGIGGVEFGKMNFELGTVLTVLGITLCGIAVYLINVYESRQYLDLERGDTNLMDKYLAKNIGDKLKEIRKEKTGVQTNVAKNIGISRAMLSRYERGEVIPSAQTLIDIADYYKVSVDYILGREEKC